MSAYAYEAARADGGLVRGVVDAASPPDAAVLLSSRGLLPILVEPAQRRAPGLFGRPSARAIATVFEGLASLFEAGVPLHKALEASRRIAPDRLSDALGRVETAVREGSSLGSALAAEEGLFPPVAVGIIRAGERGVGLGAALEQAAVYLERQAEIAARVRGALAYPLLLAVVGTGSIGLIVLFVVPRFATLLGDLGQALPAATRILLAMSDIARSYGVAMVVLIGAGVLAASRLITQHRAAWDAWLLDLPLVGALRHAVASARAARALGALLATGTPALAALDIAREAAGDAAVADRFAAARARVAQGAGLTAALATAEALTPAVLQLGAIGEGSGKLPALLAKAADLEEQTVERRLKTLVSVLEPALIVMFAGMVAFVAAALLQAVYALRPGM